MFAPVSDLLLRHSNDFKQNRILFAGDIQDELPAFFICSQSRVHIQNFQYWQILSRIMGGRARFSVIADQFDVADCDTLIYYWPKSKFEAKFQLMNLLSILPINSKIFVIGRNCSGVRSSEQMLLKYTTLNKVDSAKHCSMYYGLLKNQPAFNVNEYWVNYQYNGLIIKTLPGVFNYKKMDVGSQLLVSTFSLHERGNVLDIGCGAGILSVMLAHRSPMVNLTLTDISATAIEASRATLVANNIKGNVLASDVFSNVKGRFDLIISNPPFHNGIETNLGVAKTIIRDAICYLNSGGELRIVGNSFLPYSKILNETFGFHQVLIQTNHFKVYRTIML